MDTNTLRNNTRQHILQHAQEEIDIETLIDRIIQEFNDFYDKPKPAPKDSRNPITGGNYITIPRQMNPKTVIGRRVVIFDEYNSSLVLVPNTNIEVVAVFSTVKEAFTVARYALQNKNYLILEQCTFKGKTGTFEETTGWYTTDIHYKQ